MKNSIKVSVGIFIIAYIYEIEDNGKLQYVVKANVTDEDIQFTINDNQAVYNNLQEAIQFCKDGLPITLQEIKVNMHV